MQKIKGKDQNQNHVHDVCASNIKEWKNSKITSLTILTKIYTYIFFNDYDTNKTRCEENEAND